MSKFVENVKSLSWGELMSNYSNLVELKSKVSGFLLFLLISITLFLLVSPAVRADTLGPAITKKFPADGAVFNYTRINLSVTAYDQDYVDMASVVLTIDGVRVYPILQFAPIDESTDDYTTLYIDHWTTFSDGNHNVNLTVKDMAGNYTSKSWSFTVGEAARVTSFSPANGTTLDTQVPVITVNVTPAAGIDVSSIVMSLNNAPVSPAYDPFAGTITYIPSGKLANETWYNVYLSMKDKSGNTLSAAWNFYINTYQDMTYLVDDTACQKCHDRTTHPMSSCGKCHGLNRNLDKPDFPLDDCYSCHFDSTAYPNVYHTEGIPVDNAPDHPVQITYSCTECHTKTWGGTIIPSAHQISVLGEQHAAQTTGCTPCHSTSLTREHQTRTDSLGSEFNCYTCHNNPETKVQSAIINKDGSCTACHGTGGQHPEHNNGLDSYCQTCHSATILSDQQYHGKNSCSTCHENKSNAVVNYAFTQKDTSCFACHDEGHNVNFVRKVPSDLPLYPGYNWSIPQNATIWGGEPWMPTVFNSIGSKLVISNRRTDVTGTQIFDWYTQNLEANGWEKLSGPEEGSNYFTMDYKKGSRLLTVIVSAGASHEPTAAYVGYRIELLYK